MTSNDMKVAKNCQKNHTIHFEDYSKMTKSHLIHFGDYSKIAKSHPIHFGDFTRYFIKQLHKK